MSAHPPYAKRIGAFTLIELLTVIAIIAVLMGLLFPALSGVKNTARKAQAKNDALGIVNAVKAFYTEYGKYPLASSASGDSVDFKDNNNELFDVLRAPSTMTGTPLQLNPRKISFMEIPPAKGTGTAQKAGVTKEGKFVDPWGQPYRVRVDSDYNNSFPNPYTADAGAGPGTLNMGVVAWSLGPDTKGGSGNKSTGDSEDDVISWQ